MRTGIASVCNIPSNFSPSSNFDSEWCAAASSDYSFGRILADNTDRMARDIQAAVRKPEEKGIVAFVPDGKAWAVTAASVPQRTVSHFSWPQADSRPQSIDRSTTESVAMFEHGSEGVDGLCMGLSWAGVPTQCESSRSHFGSSHEPVPVGREVF